MPNPNSKGPPAIVRATRNPGGHLLHSLSSRVSHRWAVPASAAGQRAPASSRHGAEPGSGPESAGWWPPLRTEGPGPSRDSWWPRSYHFGERDGAGEGSCNNTSTVSWRSMECLTDNQHDRFYRATQRVVLGVPDQTLPSSWELYLNVNNTGR